MGMEQQWNVTDRRNRSTRIKYKTRPCVFVNCVQCIPQVDWPGSNNGFHSDMLTNSRLSHKTILLNYSYSILCIKIQYIAHRNNNFLPLERPIV